MSEFFMYANEVFAVCHLLTQTGRKKQLYAIVRKFFDSYDSMTETQQRNYFVQGVYQGVLTALHMHGCDSMIAGREEPEWNTDELN